MCVSDVDESLERVLDAAERKYDQLEALFYAYTYDDLTEQEEHLIRGTLALTLGLVSERREQREAQGGEVREEGTENE